MPEPDENPTDENPTDEKPTDEQKPADKLDEKPAGEGGEKSPEDELPEWARKELTKTRGEAANYRTRLREAETKLSEAKTPEDIEAAVKDLRDKNAELEVALTRSKVAREHKLPDDMAVLLTAATEADLVAQAKALAKYAAQTPDPSSLSGGLDPSDDDDGEMDPRKLARITRR